MYFNVYLTKHSNWIDFDNPSNDVTKAILWLNLSEQAELVFTIIGNFIGMLFTSIFESYSINWGVLNWKFWSIKPFIILSKMDWNKVLDYMIWI